MMIPINKPAHSGFTLFSRAHSGFTLFSRAYSGFTLFEVMIALAIIAIALAASLRAAQMGTDSALELKERTLAGWVAQDRLAWRQIRHDWPSIGLHTGVVQQAGMTFIWQETIATTPSAWFRSIEVDVFLPQQPQHRLNQLTGFLLAPGRP